MFQSSICNGYDCYTYGNNGKLNTSVEIGGKYYSRPEKVLNKWVSENKRYDDPRITYKKWVVSKGKIVIFK